MKESEALHILAAIIILFIVIGFTDLLALNLNGIGLAIFFAAALVVINIAGKKLMARRLDAQVHHKIIEFQRYGIHKHFYLKKPVPLGLILPLFISIVSLGAVKFTAALSYYTTALKSRGTRRNFGQMSMTEMTDKHQALIGAAGIVFTLLSSVIFYLIPGLEPLARLSAFYAFWNMIPFPNFDGCQIYFGWRFVWYVVGIITVLFAVYALLLI